MEFRDEKFSGRRVRNPDEPGLDPRSLELELTESVLMKRADATAVHSKDTEGERRAGGGR